MLEDEIVGNRRLQFDNLNSTTLTENFLYVLKGDVVGSIDGALDGLLAEGFDSSALSVALEAASTASLKEFSVVFLGIDTDGAGACILPDLPWCSGDGGGNSNDDKPAIFN